MMKLAEVSPQFILLLMFCLVIGLASSHLFEFTALLSCQCRVNGDGGWNGNGGRNIFC